MPPGDQGRSTPGNIADGDVPRRRRPIFVSRRCPEKISPENLKFERRVAEIQARQEEEQKQMTAAFMGSLSFTVCYPYSETLSDDHVQDGESIAWNVINDIHVTSTPLLLKDSTQQGEGQLLKDSANKPPDDTDFLEGTFYKINLDKQKATITRNKKSSKKQKKKKGKGKGNKGRKESYATEMQSEPPTQPSSTCAAATGGETLASSSSRVAVHVPQLGYSSSSSSSRVTAKLINTPAVNNPSSGNEKEPSVSSSTDDFKSFKSTTSYATAASSSVNDYAGSLSDARSERSLSASDSTDSRGFKKTSGEGNKPNVDQSLSLAVGRGCSQEALLCSDYASNDGDFQKVVSRKSAQKMKKMQRLESSTPSSTMAASSGPTIARELVPRAPFREVITIGHYINDVTFYGRKPNQRKGKYQKARSLSNLSKTGYTDGDVSGSNDTMLVITTVHQAKPRSSHHVTLEAIEETNSPRCRPKEGELKATAPPVGDGIKGTDSKAPSSDKSWSLGSLANSSCANKGGQKKAVALDGGDSGDTRAPSSDKTSSQGHLDISSCVDRKQQKKAVALVDGGTEDIDSRAPTSDKTSSSLGHLVNFSCVDREEQKKKATALVGGATQDINSRAPTSDKTSSLLGHLVSSSCADREEQKKKAMALVGGGGTKDRDSRAPTSDKTSSLCHLVKSSCVDRKEQKKAMSPVGGDSKNTDSRAVPSDITLSLCHLAISSCADSEEQKKQENRIAFSTHASSQLDKIIKAANYVYEIQAASDVYMISGIHADIETFLHAATPVIGQISCTKSRISLQDQRLWSVWRWYEQPECYGIEVQKEGKINSIWPEFSTYFRPLLSAVQLFGQSGKSPNHGGLIFEYLEMENPFSRPPIFTKIKQLRDGVNLSGNPIFGDPKQLESVKLSDLHPASWFSVAWYPICQIPAAAGSCQASFLTYHSLGKLVPQTCSTDKAVGHDPIICPIVGLLGYKEEGEKWFQLRRQLRFKSRPNVSSKSKINHAELLNKRLRALKQGASIMSKAVMPRASGNYHSDYTFFQSRFH